MLHFESVEPDTLELLKRLQMITQESEQTREVCRTVAEMMGGMEGV